MSGLLEVLSIIAPETAKVVESLQKRKVKTEEILIAMLALNIVSCDKLDNIYNDTKANSKAIKDLRKDLTDLIKKG